MTSQQNAPEKKQHWWNNVAAIYRVAKRGYPWVGWVCLVIMILSIGGVSIATPILLGSRVVGTIGWVLTGIALGMVICTFLLTRLGTKSMYKEMDGVRGAVGAVMSQAGRGWIVEQEPIAMTRKQDIVWRLVGRPGIVLISEGPHSRVSRMLNEEERKAKRVAMATPVHIIEVGHDDGQVELSRLMKTLNRLPKEISKNDVPRISQRLNSIRAKNLGMPRSIDPAKAKLNRRMFRGK